ncbi:MAG: glycosyltransferase family 4 protein [Gemmatimonadaceae bacterium]
MSRPTGIGRHTASLMSALAANAPEVSVHHVRHPRLDRIQPHALRRAMYLAWLASGIPGARLRRTLDLVHFTNYHVAPWKPRGLRYAATIHDLVPFRMPDSKSRRYTAYLRRSIVQALRVGDVVFAPSYAVRDEMVAEFRVGVDAIHVVYVPAVLTSLRAPEARSQLRRVFPELGDAPFVLSVGTLERRKNLVALLRGLSGLPAALDDLHVVLAGRPGLGYASIADAAAAVDVRRHRVHILTDCSDEDLRALYSVCEAFVLPSLYEGYGIPLLEAMQCGAPIVASDIPTSRELAGDAAVIVPPTPDGIAEGIAAVLESTGLRAALVARGRARVSAFTLEQTSRQLLEGYRSVLAPPR